MAVQAACACMPAWRCLACSHGRGGADMQECPFELLRQICGMSDCCGDRVVAFADAAHIAKCQYRSVTIQSYVPLFVHGFLVYSPEVLPPLGSVCSPCSTPSLAQSGETAVLLPRIAYN